MIRQIEKPENRNILARIWSYLMKRETPQLNPYSSQSICSHRTIADTSKEIEEKSQKQAKLLKHKQKKAKFSGFGSIHYFDVGE